jgi:hypothetical protein
VQIGELHTFAVQRFEQQSALARHADVIAPQLYASWPPSGVT